MTTELIQGRPREVAGSNGARQAPRFVPAADIYEDEESYHVWLDMPGADPQEIDVRFEQGTLSVWGKVDPRWSEGKANCVAAEYGIGDFYRAFNLTESIDASRIAAEYEDGVLRLTLPKVEAARPKRIEVKSR